MSEYNNVYVHVFVRVRVRVVRMHLDLFLHV